MLLSSYFVSIINNIGTDGVPIISNLYIINSKDQAAQHGLIR